MLVECAQCDKPVIGQTRGFVIADWDPVEAVPGSRWTLLQCNQRHPILVHQADWSNDPGAWHWDDPVRIYPSRERQLSTLIPEQLRQIHEEARACFRAKAYTAAAVMTGRALEATCSLNGIKEHTLQQSLAKMKEQGHIDGRLWEWAETLRTVRNAAAHYDSTVITKQDADDSIAFNEALLDYMYVLNTRFEELKERRAKKLADAKASAAGQEATATKSRPS